MFDQPRQEYWSATQKLSVRPEGQFQRAAAADVMRAVEIEQRVVERMTSGVQIFQVAVGAGLAQTPAPSIGKLIGEAVR